MGLFVTQAAVKGGFPSFITAASRVWEKRRPQIIVNLLNVIHRNWPPHRRDDRCCESGHDLLAHQGFSLGIADSAHRLIPADSITDIVAKPMMPRTVVANSPQVEEGETRIAAA